jgi:hypothetical protein
MKNQKKFNRKLKLNKATIARLDQEKVRGGKTAGCKPTQIGSPCPCNRTIPTEVICTLYDCLSIHICTLCNVDCSPETN